jgi:hypothetical protein
MRSACPPSRPLPRPAFLAASTGVGDEREVLTSAAFGAAARELADQ